MSSSVAPAPAAAAAAALPKRRLPTASSTLPRGCANIGRAHAPAAAPPPPPPSESIDALKLQRQGNKASAPRAPTRVAFGRGSSAPRAKAASQVQKPAPNAAAASSKSSSKALLRPKAQAQGTALLQALAKPPVQPRSMLRPSDPLEPSGPRPCARDSDPSDAKAQTVVPILDLSIIFQEREAEASSHMPAPEEHQASLTVTTPTQQEPQVARDYYMYAPVDPKEEKKVMGIINTMPTSPARYFRRMYHEMVEAQDRFEREVPRIQRLLQEVTMCREAEIQQVQREAAITREQLQQVRRESAILRAQLVEAASA